MSEARITDEQLMAAERAGLRVMCSLRGERVCCERNENLVCEAEVDGSFDINNPDHFAWLNGNLHAFRCRVCGAKYWAHMDLRDKVLMSRV